jgi:hypothetical protein
MGRIAHTPWRGIGPAHAVRSTGRNDTTTSSASMPASPIRPAAIDEASAGSSAGAEPKTRASTRSYRR